MKKAFLTIIFIIIIFIVIITLYRSKIPTVENPTINDNVIDKNTVSYNGWLHTDGYKLENDKNEIIQLHGLSSHGIEWYSDLITKDNLQTLKNDWNINIFRIAMYVDANGSGYVSNPDKNKELVCKNIDLAIENDMYVIIDWHTLSDRNPQTHKDKAKVFFEEISQKYANNPNVIYEICNEPNGDDVSWDSSIKPYAEEIIPVIRANSPNSLIIVGTPNWCKDLKQAADNPLKFDNVVYSCHFYSGTHRGELRNKIDYCINKNIPVFVSECGLTDASGNGNVYFDEFNSWISYLNDKKISWVYWSFSNKNESSAILKNDYNINNDNKKIDDYLTNSGKYIKDIFLKY